MIFIQYINYKEGYIVSNNGTFIADIKSQKMYKNLNDCIVENNSTTYPHLTFQADNVIDYLRIIKLLSKTKYEDFVSGEIIYRGMSDAS